MIVFIHLLELHPMHALTHKVPITAAGTDALCSQSKVVVTVLVLRPSYPAYGLSDMINLTDGVLIST